MDESSIRVRATIPIFVLIFVLALVIRLPSCAESFWLDELHSAWTVDGPFSEVATRAAAGNQTTGYFHFLWVWSRLVGKGEVAMRLSSVLATALAAALLGAEVTQRTGRVAAGLVAGGIMVVDVNAVFFGCELRPYAYVMLSAVLTVGSMMRWLEYESHSRGRKKATKCREAWWRLSTVFWICIASLVHPTALGVLFWLIPFAVGVAWSRERLSASRVDLISIAIVLATAIVLYQSSLSDSWEKRDLWRAFGHATRWSQLWQAWSWWPIVLLPMLLAGFAGRVLGFGRLSSRVSSSSVSSDAAELRAGPNWSSTALGCIPGIVGLLGTFLFFVASYLEVFPLWHRRYFVAALPLLAWTAGELVAFTQVQLDHFAHRRVAVSDSVGWIRNSVGVIRLVPMLAILGVLLWSQGTLQSMLKRQAPLQLRGEAWRDATELVRDQKQDGDLVWVDSQLIESNLFAQATRDVGELSGSQVEYLTFPVRGPYRLLPAIPVSSFEHDSWVELHVSSLPSTPATIWLISRTGQPGRSRFVQRLRRERGLRAVELYSGRPSVTKLVFLP